MNTTHVKLFRANTICIPATQGKRNHPGASNAIYYEIPTCTKNNDWCQFDGGKEMGVKTFGQFKRIRYPLNQFFRLD